MIIPIDKKWRISGDYHSWRIEAARTRNGRTEWHPKKWFGTYQGALRELGDLMVRTSDAQTLAEALEEVKKVSTILSQALTPRIPADSGDSDYLFGADDPKEVLHG